jgi:hypothetical protein
MPVPNDGFMKKPKYVARLGQQKILPENVVLTDGPSVYLVCVAGQNIIPHMTSSQLTESRHK